MSGTGNDNGIIQYSKRYEDIQNKSIVYTSGAGGLFKAGIPIGKINIDPLIEDKNVTFFSDFSQLRFVKLILFEKVEN